MKYETECSCCSCLCNAGIHITHPPRGTQSQSRSAVSVSCGARQSHCVSRCLWKERETLLRMHCFSLFHNHCVAKGNNNHNNNSSRSSKNNNNNLREAQCRDDSVCIRRCVCVRVCVWECAYNPAQIYLPRAAAVIVADTDTSTVADADASKGTDTVSVTDTDTDAHITVYKSVGRQFERHRQLWLAWRGSPQGRARQEKGGRRKGGFITFIYKYRLGMAQWELSLQ